MIKGFFDYNPTGQSLFGYGEDSENVRTVKLNMDRPEDLVEVVATLISTNNVHQLQCTKSAIGLASSIREYLLGKYNYTSCEFVEI